MYLDLGVCFGFEFHFECNTESPEYIYIYALVSSQNKANNEEAKIKAQTLWISLSLWFVDIILGHSNFEDEHY